MVRLCMIATQFQAMMYRLQTNIMAILALLNTRTHFFINHGMIGLSVHNLSFPYVKPAILQAPAHRFQAVTGEPGVPLTI